MTRTLDLGIRVILRDPQEFLAGTDVALQDPTPAPRSAVRLQRLVRQASLHGMAIEALRSP
jgi:hypothetical protein